MNREFGVTETHQLKSKIEEKFIRGSNAHPYLTKQEDLREKAFRSLENSIKISEKKTFEQNYVSPIQT